VYLVLKVFLGNVNTTVDNKTDIKVLTLRFISYIPLHASNSTVFGMPGAFWYVKMCGD
jgi:hypothetical protein